jgi:hypothetical protein
MLFGRASAGAITGIVDKHSTIGVPHDEFALQAGWGNLRKLQP